MASVLGLLPSAISITNVSNVGSNGRRALLQSGVVVSFVIAATPSAALAVVTTVSSVFSSGAVPAALSTGGLSGVTSCGLAVAPSTTVGTAGSAPPSRFPYSAPAPPPPAPTPASVSAPLTPWAAHKKLSLGLGVGIGLGCGLPLLAFAAHQFHKSSNDAPKIAKEEAVSATVATQVEAPAAAGDADDHEVGLEAHQPSFV